MHPIRVLFSFALALVSVASAFGYNTYTWQAVGGAWNGSYTDSAHWSGKKDGSYPGQYDESRSHEGELAKFAFTLSKFKGLDMTVTYPSGVITNLGQFILESSRATHLRFDGHDTTLFYPSPTGGKLSSGKYFQVSLGYPASLIMFPDLNSGSIPDAGLYTFKDFVFSTTNRADESRIEFESGSFTFPQVTYWKFFITGSINNNLPKRVLHIDKDASVDFESPAAFSAPSLSQGMRVDGGSLTLGNNVWAPYHYASSSTDTSADRVIFFDIQNGGTFSYGPEVSGGGESFSMGIAYKYRSYGNSSKTTVRIQADNATISQLADDYSTQTVGPGTHELILKNGSTGFFAGAVELGTYGYSKTYLGAKGLIEISDSTATFKRSIVLGGDSTTAVSYGATGRFGVSDSTVTLGTVSGSNLKLYNGSIALTNSTITLGNASACFVGVSSCGGTRTFSADGVKLLASSDAAVAPVSGFNTATIGPNGLLLDVPTAQTYAQAFDGPGTLVLAGPGDAIFTGAVSSGLVATNGAMVSFSGLSTEANPLKCLALGNRSEEICGRLTMKPNETIWVNGPVDIQALRIAIDGTLSAGDKVTIACIQGASDNVCREWNKMLFSSDLPSDLSWSTTTESFGANGVNLVATIGSQSSLTISLTSGEDTHKTNVSFGAGSVLNVVPSKNARINFMGSVGSGKLVKTGEGAVYLYGENDCLAGFVLNGGLLSFVTALAYNDSWETVSGTTLQDGTIEFQNSTTIVHPMTINASKSANGLVIFKTEADVEMPVPTMTRGAFVKRGKGRLTFNVSADSDWSGLTKGTGATKSGEYMAFDDANGTAPASSTIYGAVNVAEGELLIRGTSETVPSVSWKTSSINNETIIGIASKPEPANPAQPGLVLDHVAYVPVKAFVSGNYETWLSRQLSDGNATFQESPYLYITNGASMMANGFKMCHNNSDGRVQSNLLLDNGTLGAYFEVHLSAAASSASPDMKDTIVMRNGSAMYAMYDTGRFYVSGHSVSVDVESSVMARNANRDPAGLYIYNNEKLVTDMSFRNGSVFACHRVWLSNPSTSQTTAKKMPVNLTFDDSEWYCGSGTLTMPSPNMNVNVKTVGGGLKLNPPSGSVWTLYTRIEGPSGIVKGGAGTLYIDNWYKYLVYQSDTLTLACTGTNHVNAGTLRFKPTAVRDDVRFVLAGGTLEMDDVSSAKSGVVVSGTGTLGKGVWQGLRIVPKSGEVLTIDDKNGAVLSGSVTFDFQGNASEAEKFLDAPVVVARWTDTKPDVSTWKTRNTGIGARFKFTVNDDGTVSAQLFKRGFVVIFYD